MMEKRKKVCLYEDNLCKTVEGRWVGLRRLKELYELSNKKYLLSDSPEDADMILYGDVMEKSWTEKILGNKLIKQYAHKSFSIGYHDPPFFLSHGFQNNNEKSVLTYGRIRTGGYEAHGDKYGNPYVRSHRHSRQDYTDKDYLFSFIGRNSHKIRKELFHLNFERDDIFIEDSSKFKLWQGPEKDKLERQKNYYDILRRSKYSLCPRGSGTNSSRLFESMQLGVAPIIISDDWVFPKGPKWNEFVIIVKEKDIRNLVNIVQSFEYRYKEMGQSARLAYDEYFSEDVYFNYLVDNCFDIMSKQVIPEYICLMFTSFIFKSKVNIAKVQDQIRLRSRLKEFGMRIWK